MKTTYTQEQANALLKVTAEYENQAEVLTERITEVLETIAKCFGTGLDWWDWGNGHDETNGHFISGDLGDDYISLDGTYKNYDKIGSAILHDGVFSFEYMVFPKRFLFEDFEEELKEGILKYKEEENKKKKKAAIKASKTKAEKKKLIENAKNKLTEEERKALGI